MLTPSLLADLRCPVCGSALASEDSRLDCGSCGGSSPVQNGMPRLLDDRLPGIREKRAEIAGWVKLARAQD